MISKFAFFKNFSISKCIKVSVFWFVYLYNYVQLPCISLTIGAHAQRGLQYLVCVCVCLSVKSHLTYGASVRPEKAVT